MVLSAVEERPPLPMRRLERLRSSCAKIFGRFWKRKSQDQITPSGFVSTVCFNVSVGQARYTILPATTSVSTADRPVEVQALAYAEPNANLKVEIGDSISGDLEGAATRYALYWIGCIFSLAPRPSFSASPPSVGQVAALDLISDTASLRPTEGTNHLVAGTNHVAGDVSLSHLLSASDTENHGPRNIHTDGSQLLSPSGGLNQTKQAGVKMKAASESSGVPDTRLCMQHDSEAQPHLPIVAQSSPLRPDEADVRAEDVETEDVDRNKVGSLVRRASRAGIMAIEQAVVRQVDESDEQKEKNRKRTFARCQPMPDIDNTHISRRASRAAHCPRAAL